MIAKQPTVKRGNYNILKIALSMLIMNVYQLRDNVNRRFHLQGITLNSPGAIDIFRTRGSSQSSLKRNYEVYPSRRHLEVTNSKEKRPSFEQIA